jgi:hypothetical protein
MLYIVASKIQISMSTCYNERILTPICIYISVVCQLKQFALLALHRKNTFLEIIDFIYLKICCIQKRKKNQHIHSSILLDF